MTSHLIFEGPGPFYLPDARRTKAVGNKNRVIATVYCPATKRVQGREESRGSEPEPISVPMSASVARELAFQLIRAANEAESGREARAG